MPQRHKREAQAQRDKEKKDSVNHLTINQQDKKKFLAKEFLTSNMFLLHLIPDN